MLVKLLRKNKNMSYNRSEPIPPTPNPTSRLPDLTTTKIYYLSRHTLDPSEFSLLEKGLSFCPTNEPDEFQLFIDLNNVRKLTLTQHFSMLDSNPKSNDTFNTPILDTDRPPNSVTSGSVYPDTTGVSTSASPTPISSNLRPKSKFYPLHPRGSHIDTFYALVSTTNKSFETQN